MWLVIQQKILINQFWSILWCLRITRQIARQIARNSHAFSPIHCLLGGKFLEVMSVKEYFNSDFENACGNIDIISRKYVWGKIVRFLGKIHGGYLWGKHLVTVLKFLKYYRSLYPRALSDAAVLWLSSRK